MTIKEWFEKGRKLGEEIEALKEQKEKAFFAACNITPAVDRERVQESTQNGTERKFTKYAEYSELIDNRIAELMEYREKMLNAINKVESPIYRTLLIERYINCKSWEETAEIIGYSREHLCRELIDKALSKIE